MTYELVGRRVVGKHTLRLGSIDRVVKRANGEFRFITIFDDGTTEVVPPADLHPIEDTEITVADVELLKEMKVRW